MAGNFAYGYSGDFETAGLNEILGTDVAKPFLEYALNHPQDLAVQGIMVRAGRAGFIHWLANEGADIGWGMPEYRFAPVKKKITRGLENICSWMDQVKQLGARLEISEKTWQIVITGSRSAQWLTADLNRYFLAGFVQEFTSWAGLGKFYPFRITETTTDQGNVYCIIIQKQPLD